MLFVHFVYLVCYILVDEIKIIKTVKLKLNEKLSNLQPCNRCTHFAAFNKSLCSVSEGRCNGD